MTRTLREHQQDAYDAVRKDWADGIVRTAVVHPTGLGKGDLIGKIAADEAAAGGRVLILAHREEILDQLGKRAQAYNPAIPVGRVQGSRNETRRPITTAMIQTLARANRRARLAPPTLLIVDECHRVMSDSYLATLDWAGSFKGTRTLGLTATLVRGDRRGLGDVWQKVSHSLDIRWGVDNGWLTRPHGRVVVVDHMDLNKAKVSRGDYQDADLGEMVERDVDQIVKEWHEHASDRCTVAFVPTVASAHALAQEFLNTGVTAEVVTGETKTDERQAMYARLHDGTTQILVNVHVLVEGWDEARVDCILMARPTRQPGVYVQAVGRGLRLYPGKESCLVLDVVGTSRTQKLTTLVDLSLTVEYNRDALDDLPCEDCGYSPCECAVGDGPGEPVGRRKLLGPATYEDLDLLLETSPFTWLSTYAGRPFLPAGDRIAVLWLDRKTDLYRWGHCAAKGLDTDGKWLGEGLTLDQARQQAEAWAQREDASLSSRKAGWRRGPASEAQVAKARSLRIPEPELLGKAELSDSISIALASRMIDPRPRRVA